MKICDAKLSTAPQHIHYEDVMWPRKVAERFNLQGSNGRKEILIESALGIRDNLICLISTAFGAFYRDKFNSKPRCFTAKTNKLISDENDGSLSF